MGMGAFIEIESVYEWTDDSPLLRHKSIQEYKLPIYICKGRSASLLKIVCVVDLTFIKYNKRARCIIIM